MVYFAVLRMVESGATNVMSSERGVFAIQNPWRSTRGMRKSIPLRSGSEARCISPRCVAESPWAISIVDRDDVFAVLAVERERAVGAEGDVDGGGSGRSSALRRFVAAAGGEEGEEEERGDQSSHRENGVISG